MDTTEPVQPFAVTTQDVNYVIIEMFGGDNNLSAFALQDLEEMAAGNKGNIAIIALVDFINKPANIVEIPPGGGEIRTIENWGEIDTGDPEVLAQFLSRALVTYRKARKAIGFWDHGTGVFDETDHSEKLLTRRLDSVSRENRSRSHPARRLFFPKKRLQPDYQYRDLDITISGNRTRAMLHDDTNGGVLTNLEAGKMMEAAFRRADQREKIDLIFSDTCLNGMVEVLDELGRFAHCFVASSDLEPGEGWDYKHWLTAMSTNPPASPEDWARQAIDAFVLTYENLPHQHPCTLGAFRTEHDVTAAFANLLRVARGEGHKGFFPLDIARAKTQSFDNSDTYDIKDFASRVPAFTESAAIKGAVADLEKAFDTARIYSCCLGSMVANSHGMAFWFPGNRRTIATMDKTYRRLAFNRRTNWLDYLDEFR